jgi:hypothetical protein
MLYMLLAIAGVEGEYFKEEHVSPFQGESQRQVPLLV